MYLYQTRKKTPLVHEAFILLFIFSFIIDDQLIVEWMDVSLIPTNFTGMHKSLIPTNFTGMHKSLIPTNFTGMHKSLIPTNFTGM